ncbi:putative expansin-B2 [Abeliophyllum distichum]|uniref:Expansin-B2 n=1 Tax=Abeliophyllum distichum TaxID=126358 RepID=A0ABD1PB30_9LAMI
MVFILRNSLFTYLAIFSLLSNFCSCFNSKLLTLNVTKLQSDSDWSPAQVSWYGSPNGAGSDGGACGYGEAVGKPPFSSLITAAASSLFKSGRTCGACYQVKCTANTACSGKPVTVVITDECPGCDSEPVLFDLSGTSFGAMAISGHADQLRNAGRLQIQYRRVECNYPGVLLTFRVDTGSSAYYFAIVIEYVNGDGELAGVELKPLNSFSWLPMQKSWGAVWKINSQSPLKAPFSIKLTGDSGKTLVANHIIPAGWKPGQIYTSVVNF